MKRFALFSVFALVLAACDDDVTRASNVGDPDAAGAHLLASGATGVAGSAFVEGQSIVRFTPGATVRRSSHPRARACSASCSAAVSSC